MRVSYYIWDLKRDPNLENYPYTIAPSPQPCWRYDAGGERSPTTANAPTLPLTRAKVPRKPPLKEGYLGGGGGVWGPGSAGTV